MPPYDDRPTYFYAYRADDIKELNVRLNTVA